MITKFGKKWPKSDNHQKYYPIILDKSFLTLFNVTTCGLFLSSLEWHFWPMVFFTNQYIKFLIWYNQSNINHFLLAIYFTSYDIHMLPHVNVDLCGKKVGTYLPTYLQLWVYNVHVHHIHHQIYKIDISDLLEFELRFFMEASQCLYNHLVNTTIC